MPFSALLSSRSKTDYVKHLKECLTIIEIEHDKEKKNYDEVTTSESHISANGIHSICFRQLRIFIKHYLL